MVQYHWARRCLLCKYLELGTHVPDATFCCQLVSRDVGTRGLAGTCICSGKGKGVSVHSSVAVSRAILRDTYHDPDVFNDGADGVGRRPWR